MEGVNLVLTIAKCAKALHASSVSLGSQSLPTTLASLSVSFLASPVLKVNLLPAQAVKKDQI